LLRSVAQERLGILAGKSLRSDNVCSIDRQYPIQTQWLSAVSTDTYSTPSIFFAQAFFSFQSFDALGQARDQFGELTDEARNLHVAVGAGRVFVHAGKSTADSDSTVIPEIGASK
jgi:hypothetical protein